jgi:hypothetical protein
MARSIEQIRKIFPYSDDCFELEKTIGKIINEKSFYALKINSGEISVLDIRLKELNNFFSKKNCDMILGNKKLQDVSNISSKYGEIDRLRIETESITQRNKRIYVGVGIVLLGVAIILITNRK